MSPVIGIDLGTTNSLVAYLEDGKPVLLPNALGERSTPSVVGLDKQGRFLVGKPARNQLVIAPDRTLAEVKRSMGESEPMSLGDRRYSATELSSFILRSLKEDAERFLGKPVTEAVITVPAYFTDSQRQATREAGELAGLKVERILNEPTAAALAYGLDHLEQDAHVLVYDLGGGTFDVSVLEMFSGVLEVKASAGNARLGGADFDAAIIGWMQTEIQREYGLSVAGDRAAMARLKQAAEQAKIELTASLSSTINLPFLGMKDGSPVSPMLELDRSTFERLIENLVKSTLEPVASALKDAKLEPSQIQEILLIGGSSRIPLVQKLVEQFFRKKPRFEVNPEEAVALGAAVQAGLKSGAISASTGIMITDVSPFTLGVEASRRVGESLIPGFFLPIIPRNSTIPITRSQIVSTTFDGQTLVTVRVFQGDSHLCKNNVFLDEYTIDGLPPARAGQERLEIAFTYDINGILQVKTTILSNGRSASLQVSRQGPSADAQARLAADWSGGSLEEQVARLWATEQMEEALSLMEKSGEKSTATQLLLARCLLKAGRPVPAERLLETLVREGSPAAQRELGLLLRATGRWDEALLLLEGAEAWGDAGTLALQMGNTAHAFPNLRKALEQLPGDPALIEAWELASLQASSPLDLNLPLSARHFDWLWGRSRTLLKSGAFSTSPLLRAVEAALSSQDLPMLLRLPLSETDPLPLWLRAEAQLLQRHFPEAEAAFENVTTRWPALLPGWLRLAQLRSDRPALALPALQQWCALSPKDPEAEEALGDACWALGQRREALAAWQKAELAGSESATQKRGLASRIEGLPGSIFALAWHPRGGEATAVQAMTIPGDGSLSLTGNMGHTCEEAARVAWSCLRSRAAELGVPSVDTSLHLHFSSLTMEKDGPSAGLAFFLAGLSALKKVPLPPTLAVTGEVDLFGSVRAVGGLEGKLRAALLAGVRKVLVPRQNLPQIQALPLDLQSSLVVCYVSTVMEAATRAWE